MFKILAYLFNTTMNGFTFILNIIYTGVSTILISVLNTQRFLDISAQVVRTGKEVILYAKKENAD